MVSKINWKYCQTESDIILADGLLKLLNSKHYNFNDDYLICCGNYLISESDIHYYIGETKNFKKRLKQQSKENSSTFYKNYIKKYGVSKELMINDFSVRILETSIGRKELEEFGIVNLPTKLNRFNKGKRKLFENTSDIEIWDDVQSNAGELLQQGESVFLDSRLVYWYEAVVPKKPGIYWVENKKDGLIYIGESSNINARWMTHSKETYFSALRRHIGTELLDYKLKEKSGRKRIFLSIEDDEINSYLKNCLIRFKTISFGRFELEKYLIRNHIPLLTS